MSHKPVILLPTIPKRSSDEILPPLGLQPEGMIANRCCCWRVVRVYAMGVSPSVAVHYFAYDSDCEGK